MAHTRTTSTLSTTSGTPHAVSLKVLRLSRPSLAAQTPLPQTNFGDGNDIAPNASRAYPSADSESSFPLTPLLTLPPAFGAAYVGETLVCTLCANCEVRAGERRGVSGVRVLAELQTPSNQAGAALELEQAEDGEDEDRAGDGKGSGELQLGATLQRTLRHELKEEGPHVLAVTVSYTETVRDEEGGASMGGRIRTFRKLYQFVAQPIVAVRSKVTERKRRDPKSEDSQSWILEAQLENVGETSVVLEKVWLREREGTTSVALNGQETKEAVVLKPQDVEQVMFILRMVKGQQEEGKADRDGRVPLAQLNIDWRSAMGEKGSLTTGWLASRGR